MFWSKLHKTSNRIKIECGYKKTGKPHLKDYVRHSCFQHHTNELRNVEIHAVSVQSTLFLQTQTENELGCRGLMCRYCQVNCSHQGTSHMTTTSSSLIKSNTGGADRQEARCYISTCESVNTLNGQICRLLLSVNRNRTMVARYIIMKCSFVNVAMFADVKPAL